MTIKNDLSLHVWLWNLDHYSSIISSYLQCHSMFSIYTYFTFCRKINNQDLFHPNTLSVFIQVLLIQYSPDQSLFLWPDFVTGIQNSNDQAEYNITYILKALVHIILWSFACLLSLRQHCMYLQFRQ